MGCLLGFERQEEVHATDTTYSRAFHRPVLRRRMSGLSCSRRTGPGDHKREREERYKQWGLVTARERGKNGISNGAW